MARVPDLCEPPLEVELLRVEFDVEFSVLLESLSLSTLMGSDVSRACRGERGLITSHAVGLELRREGVNH